MRAKRKVRTVTINYNGQTSYIRVLPHISDDEVVSKVTLFMMSFAEANIEPPDKRDFVWCPTAEVINAHVARKPYIRRGTKDFAPGTRVYCFPVHQGYGYHKVVVTGIRRKGKKYVKVLMSPKYLKKWKVIKVYGKSLMKQLKSGGWSDNDMDRFRVEMMVSWLQDKTTEELSIETTNERKHK
jgi:hypothetical protein